MGENQGGRNRDLLAVSRSRCDVPRGNKVAASAAVALNASGAWSTLHYHAMKLLLAVTQQHRAVLERIFAHDQIRIGDRLPVQVRSSLLDQPPGFLFRFDERR